MFFKWVMRTIPRDGKPDVLKLGAYPHNVYARTGISGPGTFSVGLGCVTDEQRPALLWLYNRAQKAYDQKHNTPMETTSGYPHHAILAFVNWPFGEEEKNPAACIPQAVRDEKFGFYMMRNRWQDENDVLVQIQTKSTRGWHKASTKGDIHVWAGDKKIKWGQLRGTITHWQPASDGSAIATSVDGTSLAVDFSKASGADAMLVMTGPTAGRGTTVKVGGREYSFLFVGGDDPPQPKADGDSVAIGAQRVSFAGGHITIDKPGR